MWTYSSNRGRPSKQHDRNSEIITLKKKYVTLCGRRPDSITHHYEKNILLCNSCGRILPIEGRPSRQQDLDSEIITLRRKLIL